MKKWIWIFGCLWICSLPFAFCSCDTTCLHPNESIEVVSPSCDKEGYTLHTCPDCSAQYKTDTVIPTGHTLSEKTIAPTCTKEGYTEYSCACGYTYKGSFCAPTGHAYTKNLVPPDCESEGYTEYTCSCGHSYVTDYTAPVGHSYVKTATAPTCESEGYTTYACACGHSYVSDHTAPLGHSYVEATTAPTCDSEGYTEHTCTACRSSYRTQILSALGHTYSSAVIAPTCVDQGYTAYTCVSCDSAYRSDYIAPLGHKMTVTHVAHPTLSSLGRLTHHCSVCEYHFTNALLYNDVFANAYTDNTVRLAKGVDISYHNHTPDSALPGGYAPLNWTAIKDAGFDFAILRAGYAGFHDPVFEMNYADAKAAGMDLGAYYYAHAQSVEDAKAEAAELLSWLEGKQFEYPIYYDMEDSSLTALDKDLLTEICITFVIALRDAGYYSAVYSNNDWLSNRLHGEELKNFCEIWYARYQKDPTADSEHFEAFTVSADNNDFSWLKQYGGQVGLWQYTQCGVIENSGIREKVDFNYAYKDYPTYMKTFCLNGYTTSP